MIINLTKEEQFSFETELRDLIDYYNICNNNIMTSRELVNKVFNIIEEAY